MYNFQKFISFNRRVLWRRMRQSAAICERTERRKPVTSSTSDRLGGKVPVASHKSSQPLSSLELRINIVFTLIVNV